MKSLIDSRREPLWALALLAAVILLASGLRLYKLGDYGLWRDEAEAVFTASAAFPLGIVRTLSEDVHAPLYFFLSHFWFALSGRSEFGVRAFSAFCGILVIPLLYRVGRELFDRRLGMLAAWLGAILPLHIACSRTARMYSLLPLVGTLALWTLYRALEGRGRAYWLGYIVAAAATAYTHYWGILWVIALSLYAFLQLVLEQRAQADWRRWLLAEMGVGLLFAPWLPIFFRQLGIQGAVMGDWLERPSKIADLLRLFNELTALNWPAGRPYLWMALLALGIFSLRWYRGSAQRAAALEIGYEMSSARNLLVLGLFVPMFLGVFVLAGARGLTPSYVTMAVYPALCLWLGLAFSRLCGAALWPDRASDAAPDEPGKTSGLRAAVGRAVCALLLGGTSFLWLRADMGLYHGPISSLREVARYVEQYVEHGDVIVIAPDYLAPTFNYYYQGRQTQIAFPWLFRRVENMDWVNWAGRRSRAAEAVNYTLGYIAEAGPEGKIWLIAPLLAYPGDPFFDQIRALKSALDQRYQLVRTIERFRGPVETADILIYANK